MALRLKIIEPHQGLFLLKDCFAAPHSMFILTSAPRFQHSGLLSQFDSTLRRSSKEICNVTMDDIGWSLAKMSTRFRGLGLRAISDVALSAHLSPRFSSLTLCQKIMGNTCKSSIRAAYSLIGSIWSHPRPDNVNCNRLGTTFCATSRRES